MVRLHGPGLRVRVDFSDQGKRHRFVGTTTEQIMMSTVVVQPVDDATDMAWWVSFETLSKSTQGWGSSSRPWGMVKPR